MGNVFSVLIGVGFVGSVVTMVRFSKYCGLLNQRWTLDQETAERYQHKAQRYLAATGCLLVVAIGAMIISAILY